MDLKMSRCIKVIWPVLIFGLGLLVLPLPCPAESDLFKNFSFDDCDPFEARALIMALNGEKTQLIAAEQTIYVVDWTFGHQRLATELTDADGSPLDFGSLRRGQWVYVKGFKHIDGGVVASLVQRIDPPHRDKPLLREISKESRRYKRIKRRAAVAAD